MSTDLTESRRNRMFSELRRRLVGALRTSNFREQAEDLAHTAIALALKKYPEVDNEQDLLKLLFTIKGFLLLGEGHRRRTGQPPETGLDPVDDRPDPEQTLTRSERYAQLEAGIDQLGPRCQKLIRYRLEGKESPAIASIMEVTVNNLHVMEKRCMDRLRGIVAGSAGGGRK